MNEVRTTKEYAFNPSYERNQSFKRLVAWLHSQRYRHVIDAVKPVAPVDRPLQVLDLGRGLGKLYDVLREPFRVEYTGVDPQAGYLDTANERYGASPGFSSFCTSAADPDIFDHDP